MPLTNFREVGLNAYQGGQNWTTPFRKVSGLASQQGTVVDLSIAPGNPRPNYYTGNSLTATRLTSAFGIWHGGNVEPARTKHLHTIAVLPTTAAYAPGELYLLDYLQFYPQIEMDVTEDQYFENPLPLPRYSDGRGVQAFLVATNPYVGGAQFYITYTNQNGVSGRRSRVMISNTYGFIGTVVHSGPQAGMHGTFINLAPGDNGIRSVESITFLSSNGGLAALVLCNRVAKVGMYEAITWAEWDYLTMMREPTLRMRGATPAFRRSVPSMRLLGLGRDDETILGNTTGHDGRATRGV